MSQTKTPGERGHGRLEDQRYHALFDSMDEGFCIIEFLDGPHGPLSDYIHIEANAAYERHAGIPNVVGQKGREMAPDEAEGWIELYGGVARTGQPIRFQRELIATGRHLELSSFRPDLKVLFVTGYAKNAALNHGHVAHGMEVLTKPFGVDDLKARAARLLRAVT